MPRTPTGRPRGRQLGSGVLGLGTQDQHDRLTLRIPHDLYTRLEAFAEGRQFHRGSPKLATCVRDAIAHYLTCPHRRQTLNTEEDNTGQTSTVPRNGQHIIGQTSNSVEDHEDNSGQTRNVSAEAHSARPRKPVAIAQPSAQPGYDPTADMLGPLCENNHNYQGTGQSPRRRSDNECRQCRRERNAAYKARKRQAAP